MSPQTVNCVNCGDLCSGARRGRGRRSSCDVMARRGVLMLALLALMLAPLVAMAAVAPVDCYDATPDLGGTVLWVTDARSVLSRCVGYWCVRARVRVRTHTCACATQGSRWRRGSTARRGRGGRVDSDRVHAPYIGLSNYASSNRVECTCFSALPGNNISSSVCASTCADTVATTVCGDYAPPDAAFQPHPVAVFDRDEMTAAVACEQTCRCAPTPAERAPRPSAPATHMHARGGRAVPPRFPAHARAAERRRARAAPTRRRVRRCWRAATPATASPSAPRASTPAARRPARLPVRTVHARPPPLSAWACGC